MLRKKMMLVPVIQKYSGKQQIQQTQKSQTLFQQEPIIMSGNNRFPKTSRTAPVIPLSLVNQQLASQSIHQLATHGSETQYYQPVSPSSASSPSAEENESSKTFL